MKEDYIKKMLKNYSIDNFSKKQLQELISETNRLYYYVISNIDIDLRKNFETIIDNQIKMIYILSNDSHN